MNLILIPQDKANHAIYGAVIFLIFAFLLGVGGVPHATGFALLAVVIVGAIKELSDYILNRRAAAHGLPAPHTIEFMDAFATTLGGLACYAAASL